jgi:hypothetical protein
VLNTPSAIRRHFPAEWAQRGADFAPVQHTITLTFLNQDVRSTAWRTAEVTFKETLVRDVETTFQMMIEKWISCKVFFRNNCRK